MKTVFESERNLVTASTSFLSRNLLTKTIVQVNGDWIFATWNRKREVVLMQICGRTSKSCSIKRENKEAVRDIILVSSNTNAQLLHLFLLTKCFIECYDCSVDLSSSPKQFLSIQLQNILNPIEMILISSKQFRKEVLFVLDSKGYLYRHSFPAKTTNENQIISEVNKFNQNYPISSVDLFNSEEDGNEFSIITDKERKMSHLFKFSGLVNDNVPLSKSSFPSLSSTSFSSAILQQMQILSSDFITSLQRSGTPADVYNNNNSTDKKSVSLSFGSSFLSSASSVVPLLTGKSDPLLAYLSEKQKSSTSSLNPAAVPSFTHILPGGTASLQDSLHVPTINEIRFLDSLTTTTTITGQRKEEITNHQLLLPSSSDMIPLVRPVAAAGGISNQKKSDDTNFAKSLFSISDTLRGDEETPPVTLQNNHSKNNTSSSNSKNSKEDQQSTLVLKIFHKKYSEDHNNNNSNNSADQNLDKKLEEFRKKYPAFAESDESNAFLLSLPTNNNTSDETLELFKTVNIRAKDPSRNDSQSLSWDMTTSFPLSSMEFLLAVGSSTSSAIFVCFLDLRKKEVPSPNEVLHPIETIFLPDNQVNFIFRFSFLFA
jgi:hypothetical protein